LDSTLGTLGSEYGANREFQGGLRDILMQQLGTAGQPVSATDPNLSPILQAQRATAQRTAERQRSALAGRASGMGLSNSGAMDTGLLGIEQQRGEAEMQGLSSVMGAEQQQRRQMLMGLLNPALALGDSQATQNISQQLGIMGSQLDQSNTYDDAGYRLAALEALLNQQALGGLGGYL
jgi:hypothetical protein